MERNKTAISDESFHPLDVELMDFTHMPDKRAVSLMMRDVRIVNLSPRTALNLLAWLRGQEATLEELAKRESEQ